MKYIFSIVLLALSVRVFAFDSVDSGEYAIFLNSTGEPLDRTFAITMVESKWVFWEKTDGKYIQRECTGKYEFKKSSKDSIKKMFLNGEHSLLKDVACIENHAFALCSFIWPKENKKGYVMVAFLESGPAPMALRSLGPVKIKMVDWMISNSTVKFALRAGTALKRSPLPSRYMALFNI